MAAATHLVITGSASQTAGTTQNLTITAKDGGGVTDTGYIGDKSLTFSGASIALDGTTHPTVKDKTGAATNFGTATTITFTLGVATVSAGSNGVMALYKAESAVIACTDGTISAAGADRLTVAVSAAAAGGLTVVAADNAINYNVYSATPSEYAGLGLWPIVKAVDTWLNVDTTYTGDKSLTFSGAALAPDGTHPVVVDKTLSSVNFGSAATITFTSGVMTAAFGTANAMGALSLVKEEVATVAITDGALTTSTGSGSTMAVTVYGYLAASYAVAGSATQTAGLGQDLVITGHDANDNPATAQDGLSDGLAHVNSQGVSFAFGPTYFVGADPDTAGHTPTVTDHSGTAIPMGGSLAVLGTGTPCNLNFVAGVATASGSLNGLMTLYKPGATTVEFGDAFGDDTLATNGVPLAVTVSKGGITNNPIIVAQVMAVSYQNQPGKLNNLAIFPRRIYWYDPQATSDKVVIKTSATGKVLWEATCEAIHKSQYVELQEIGDGSGSKWNDWIVTVLDSGTLYIWFTS
jgi:hypothetical protein